MAELTKEQQVRYTEVLVDASDKAVNTWGGDEDMMVLASRYNAAMATAVAIAAREDLIREIDTALRDWVCDLRLPESQEEGYFMAYKVFRDTFAPADPDTGDGGDQ